MWLYFRWNVCVIICQSQGQLIDILCSTQIKYFYEEGTQHHQCTAKLDARIGSYIDNPWPKSYLYVGEICKKWSENTSKIVKILLVKEFWQIYRFLCPHPFFSKLHSAVSSGHPLLLLSLNKSHNFFCCQCLSYDNFLL